MCHVNQKRRIELMPPGREHSPGMESRMEKNCKLAADVQSKYVYKQTEV